MIYYITIFKHSITIYTQNITITKYTHGKQHSLYSVPARMIDAWIVANPPPSALLRHLQNPVLFSPLYHSTTLPPLWLLPISTCPLTDLYPTQCRSFQALQSPTKTNTTTWASTGWSTMCSTTSVCISPPPSPRITSDEAETDFFCYILARIHPGYQRIPNPHQWPPWSRFAHPGSTWLRQFVAGVCPRPPRSSRQYDP